MPLGTPGPLRTEHNALHEALAHAMRAGGRTGEAATAVAKLLHPHFVKEEDFALPPLGLLSELARGTGPSSTETAEAIAKADRLKAELPQMLAEHREIVRALENLTQAAQTERHPEVARFAEDLIAHARTEEEVLYPATIMLGEYLKLREVSGSKAGPASDTDRG